MMDRDRLAKLVWDAVGYSLGRDAERASAVLDEIGEQGDSADMYAACCGFAEIGRTALVKIYGDRAADKANGDMWILEEIKPGALGDDPPKAFAARFLIAYANGDSATTAALFSAAFQAGSEQYVDSVCALLADVVGIAHLATKEAAP